MYIYIHIYIHLHTYILIYTYIYIHITACACARVPAGVHHTSTPKVPQRQPHRVPQRVPLVAPWCPRLPLEHQLEYPSSTPRVPGTPSVHQSTLRERRQSAASPHPSTSTPPGPRRVPVECLSIASPKYRVIFNRVRLKYPQEYPLVPPSVPLGTPGDRLCPPYVP